MIGKLEFLIMKLLERLLPTPDWKEEPDPFLPPDDERLAPLRRRCWKPVVEEGDGAVDGSKFSGSPALPAGESWPICPNCGRRMQLFLQLASRDFPQGASAPWERGIAQLFYCTSVEPLCESDCKAYAPFSRSTVARVLDASAEIGTEAPDEEALPARRIIGWEEIDDLPDPAEAEAEGLADAEVADLLVADCTREGDKLFGWPAWIQNPDYPDCPRCGARMTLLFQIDSEDNVPYMFGDLGRGHLTYCPTHPEILGFGWACY